MTSSSPLKVSSSPLKQAASQQREQLACDLSGKSCCFSVCPDPCDPRCPPLSHCTTWRILSTRVSRWGRAGRLSAPGVPLKACWGAGVGEPERFQVTCMADNRYLSAQCFYAASYGEYRRELCIFWEMHLTAITGAQILCRSSNI